MSKMSEHFLNTAVDRAASAEADTVYYRDVMRDMAARIESIRAVLIDRCVCQAADIIDGLHAISAELRAVAGVDAAKVAAAVIRDIEAGEMEF